MTSVSRIERPIEQVLVPDHRTAGTPVMRCRRCGYVGPAAEPDVTVRRMILSFGRFGIAPAEEVTALEKPKSAEPRTENNTLTACAARRGNRREPELIDASIQVCEPDADSRQYFPISLQGQFTTGTYFGRLIRTGMRGSVPVKSARDA